jgi:GTP-binding protein
VVDKILHACKLFRDNEETGELILDSNDLERNEASPSPQRTFPSNTKDFKINIIDTPGHADFEGEWKECLKWPTECSCFGGCF